MSIPNEGTPAPTSEEAKAAIAALEKEGHTIEGKEPAPVVEPVKEPEKPKEEPVVEPVKEPARVARTPTMVEAWKLKVAEDQKAGLERDLLDMKAKLDGLSRQDGPITVAQEKEIADEIKAIADEAGIDPAPLTKVAEAIMKRAPKPSSDIQKELTTIKQERELEKQVNVYNSEFENDVLPLVKELNLSAEALSKLKSELKDFAFSETYAKVPLKDIFKIKQDVLDIKAPKKSSEGKGVKVRATATVDLDNVTEEDISKMSAEEIVALEGRNRSSGWSRPASKK